VTCVSFRSRGVAHLERHDDGRAQRAIALRAADLLAGHEDAVFAGIQDLHRRAGDDRTADRVMVLALAGVTEYRVAVGDRDGVGLGPHERESAHLLRSDRAQPLTHVGHGDVRDVQDALRLDGAQMVRARGHTDP
jgi:hypothetical protein